MARPGYGPNYVNETAQIGGYGHDGRPQTTPAAQNYPQSHPPDAMGQWTGAPSAQSYSQQWQSNPPRPSTTPAAQYNPSAYGTMPGGQHQAYAQPLPTYAQIQQQQQPQSRPPNVEPPPGANQGISQVGRPSPGPPLTSLPSGYQTEVQQNNEGWPQHPPYSDRPPTHQYQPAWGQNEPPAYAPAYGEESQAPSYATPPPPPPKQPVNAYPPPPPPKQQQPGPPPQTQFSPTSVYSSDDATPNSAQPEYSQAFPPSQQQYSPALNYRPDQSTPRPTGVPSWSPENQQSNAVEPPKPSQPPKQRPPPSQQVAPSSYGQSQPIVQGRPHPPARPLRSRPPQPRPPQSRPPPVSQPPTQQSISPPIQGQPPYPPPQAWQSQGSTGGQFGRPPPAPAQDSQYDQQVEPVSPLQRQSVSSDRTEDARFSVSGGPSRTASMVSRDSVSVSDILSPPPMPEPRLAVPSSLGAAASASALGFGRPGDWEYYGSGPEEIDDTAMYGSKSEQEDAVESQPSHGVELPSGPSPPAVQGRLPEEGRKTPNNDQLTQAPQRSNEPSPRSRPADINAQPSLESQQRPATVPPPTSIQPLKQDEHQMKRSSSDRKQGTPSFSINTGSQPPDTASTSFAIDDGTNAPPQSQFQARNTQREAFVPAETHNAAMQDLQQKMGSLRAAFDKQQHDLQEMQQQLDEGQRRAEKDASEVRKAKAETTDIQNKLVQSNAAHAVVKEELNNQRDHFQSKLAESEAALSTVKEQHASKLEALRNQLKEAETKAKEVKKSFDSEKENLQSQITESMHTIEVSKAELDTLRKQLDEQKQISDGLEKQVEDEKAKSAAAANATAGLDPWFQGSLERFRDALFSEAAAPTVQEKLKSFIQFVNSESRLRGVDLPFGPAGEPKGFPQQPTTPPRESKPQQPKVKSPPSDYVVVEPDQYSPGGRPIVHRASEVGQRPTSSDSQRPGDAAAGAADSRRLSGEPAQGYKPYRRDGSTSRERPTSSESHSSHKLSSPTTQWLPGHPPPFNRSPASAPTVPTKLTIRPQDETFLNELLSGRPRNYSTDSPEIKDPSMVPQPLKPKASGLQPPIELDSSASAPEEPKTPLERLANLLPSKSSEQRQPSPRLQSLRKELASLPSDYSWISQLSQKWEHSTSSKRDRLDKERRERLAAVEQRSNDLFDAGEIGYEDIGVLEEKAKEEEADKEAKEEKVEYDSYAQEVFAQVWGRLEDEIGKVIEIERAATEMVEKAVAGGKALLLQDGDGGDYVGEAITVLLEAHRALESRNDRAADAVRERDRKYKRSETKPLYAKGDIAGMKNLEKHFEVMERRTDVRTKVEKVERTKVLWKKVDSAVTKGMKGNEEYIDSVLSAVEAVRDDKRGRQNDGEKKERDEVLGRTKDALSEVAKSSRLLMQHFETVEMDLNDSEYEVSVASAKLEGAGADVFESLRREKGTEDGRLKKESEKRLRDVEQDRVDGEGLVDEVLGVKAPAPSTVKVAPHVVDEEAEKKKRLEAALLEAKRRNGEAV